VKKFLLPRLIALESESYVFIITIHKYKIAETVQRFSWNEGCAYVRESGKIQVFG